MAAVPLCMRRQCIGVIVLVNRMGERGFTQDYLEILLLFAEHAAVAYTNADRYRFVNDEFFFTA